MPRKPAKAAPENSRPIKIPSAKVNVAKLSDVDLLETAILCTPDPLKPGRAIPATRFAPIAMCNDRTLRRYQAGTRPLPPLLREKLEHHVLAAIEHAGQPAKVPA